jgi:hypothetical protein
MTFRELLSKFSLDELWHYLSMCHGLQSKPIKAHKMRELYGAARDELLALELNQDETHGELSCDFCSDKIDGWDDTFFDVSLKESEETYAIDFMPWTDIIDLPVSQASLDRYGEWACAAEILWRSTFYGFSAHAVAFERDLLDAAIQEVESGKAELKSFDPDEYKHAVDSLDVEAMLSWFANAPDCVKRSARNYILANVASDENNEQSAVAKTLEKLKKIVDNELKIEDIVGLPFSMARGLDIDEMLLLLKAFDGALIN